MKDNIKNLLEQYYNEELKDCSKYKEAAKMAKDFNEIKISKIFCDLSKEEHSHAKILKCLMEE